MSGAILLVVLAFIVVLAVQSWKGRPQAREVGSSIVVSSTATTSTTTVPLPVSTTAAPPCPARTTSAAVNIRAEPNATAPVDDHIVKGHRLCVLLTSKNGRWIYVRYSRADANPADVCTGDLTTCSVGWIRKTLTVDGPTTVPTEAPSPSPAA